MTNSDPECRLNQYQFTDRKRKVNQFLLSQLAKLQVVPEKNR